jgi:hypothetical protein
MLQLMRMRSIFSNGLLILTFQVTSLIHALPSKGMLLKWMEQGKSQLSFPYSGKITTKVFMGNQTMKDSGTVFYQPIDCMQMQMFGANTFQSSCGDTTWIRAANGTISRSIGGDVGASMGMPGMANFKISGSQLPDTNAMTTSVSNLENSIKVALVQKEGQLTLDIDTLKKVILKVVVQGQGKPTLETGFGYQLFNGIWLPTEMRTSLPGGFFVLTYSEYKKEKKRPRKSFRLL